MDNGDHLQGLEDNVNTACGYIVDHTATTTRVALLPSFGISEAGDYD